MISFRAIRTVLTILLIGLLLYTAGKWYQSLQDVESAKDSLELLYEQLKQKYRTQYSINQKLKIDNDSLRLALKELNVKANTYLKLIAHYQTLKDTIHTRDTIYITINGDTLPGRRFAQWIVQDEVWINGWFQLRPPYQLYVDSLNVLLNPEIVLTQDKDGKWLPLVATNSSYLTIDSLAISVRPYRPPFFRLKPRLSLFYGMGYPGTEFGIMADIRVWKARPYVLLTNHRANFGVAITIWN